MKTLHPLFILFLFSSCISINSNGYRELSTQKKLQLQDFSANSVNEYDGNHPVKEMTAPALKSYIKPKEYTWVYIFVPYCKDSSCKPLMWYERTINNYKSKKINFLAISQVYDMGLINKQRQGFEHTVYIIKDAAYGHNMYKARDRFTAELLNDNPISRSRPAHMLFKRDSLIYYSAVMNKHAIDSVMARN